MLLNPGALLPHELRLSDTAKRRKTWLVLLHQTFTTPPSTVGAELRALVCTASRAFRAAEACVSAVSTSSVREGTCMRRMQLRRSLLEFLAAIMRRFVTRLQLTSARHERDSQQLQPPCIFPRGCQHVEGAPSKHCCKPRCRCGHSFYSTLGDGCLAFCRCRLESRQGLANVERIC